MDDYGLAARHFAAAGEVAEYAQLLLQWSQRGYSSEMDLFFCRAVLHMLSLGRCVCAMVVLQYFVHTLQTMPCCQVACASFL